MGDTAQIPPRGPFHVLFLVAAPRGALLGLSPLIFSLLRYIGFFVGGLYAQAELSLPTTKWPHSRAGQDSAFRSRFFSFL